MYCLSNILPFSMNKPIAANATLPSKPDSSPPPPPPPSSSSSSQRINAPQRPPSLGAAKTTPSSLPRNRLRRRLPQPSVLRMERVVGTGSFRDGEPEPRDSDVRKTVFDLFLGQAFEGPVEKKLRETGEWVAANSETRLRSAGKGTLMFMFVWMIPIWALLLLIASGIIKLPFSSPLVDEILL